MIKLFLLLCFYSGGDDGYKPNLYTINFIPMPTNMPDELKGYVWHRRETENFVILSLDESRLNFLVNNIEKIKFHIYDKWGMNNINFQKRKYFDEVGEEPGVMVICVPTKELMKKLFDLEQSHTEIFYENNKIKKSVLWLLLDESPIKDIPQPLSVVCYKEYNDISWWAIRGMSLINSELDSVKTLLQSDFDQVNYFKLKNTDMQDWINYNDKDKNNYDINSMYLVYLLYNEFGKSKFLQLINKNKNISNELKFKSEQEFESTFERFKKYLKDDLLSGKTPDNYLLISSER